MAELRIRVELQRASKGVEMLKLVELADQAQKLFKAVAEDVGLGAVEGVWVAEDFYNQGVGFNSSYKFTDVDPEQVAQYLHAIDTLSRLNSQTGWRADGVKPQTVVHFARLARVARDGETVRLGFLDDDDIVREWRPLEKPQAEAIIEHYEAAVEYRGMLQGRIHSLYKEVNPPYFTLRDFASSELVRCEFKPSEWAALHKALARKDGVVVVAGWVRAKRLDRSVEVMRVDRIKDVAPLDRDELSGFFGSAPGWTGDMATDEFIDVVRRSDGED